MLTRLYPCTRFVFAPQESASYAKNVGSVAVALIETSAIEGVKAAASVPWDKGVCSKAGQPEKRSP